MCHSENVHSSSRYQVPLSVIRFDAVFRVWSIGSCFGSVIGYCTIKIFRLQSFLLLPPARAFGGRLALLHLLVVWDGGWLVRVDTGTYIDEGERLMRFLKCDKEVMRSGFVALKVNSSSKIEICPPVPYRRLLKPWRRNQAKNFFFPPPALSSKFEITQQQCYINKHVVKFYIWSFI